MNGLLNDVMQVAGAGCSSKGKSMVVKCTQCGGREEGEFYASQLPPPRPLRPGTSLGLADRLGKAVTKVQQIAMEMQLTPFILLRKPWSSSRRRTSATSSASRSLCLR